MKRRFFFYGALIGAGLLCDGRILRSCVNLPETIFTDMKHPDSPLKDFASGKLGIVHPTFNRAYLYIAYRNIAGPGFSAAEQNALFSRETTTEARAGSPAQPSEADWVKTWLEARNRIPGVEAKNDMGWSNWGPFRLASRNNFSYAVYFNCGSDAFRTAVRTLHARAARFGSASETVRDWVRTQDKVFANCQEGERIPDPAPAGAPALFRADRAYQIAAAYFYGGDFESAERIFNEIAKDKSSPWSGIAPYLVARCLIRRATVGHDDDKPDLTLLARAEEQLKNVLSHGAPGESRAAAQKLLGYVAARLYPQQRLLALSQALMKKDSQENLKQRLWDYTFILDKLLNERMSDPSSVQQTRRDKFDALADLRRQDNLTDWILTFQLESPKALRHSLGKWRRTRSPAWLLAAISKLTAGNPNVPELIAAAQKIAPESAAYVSTTFYTLRLMVQSGKRGEARDRLDRFLKENSSSLPRSSLNLFLALRTDLARNLDEFVQNSQRFPLDNGVTGYFAGSSTTAPGPRFDADSVTVLNRMMPLELLEELAKDPSLAADLRRQVAAAVWLRALLSGKDSDALRLAPVLQSLIPEGREDLEAFRTAPSPSARRYAAVYFLLKSPGARPYITGLVRATPWNRLDDLHENWWRKGSLCGLAWEFYDDAHSGGAASWPTLGPALRLIYPVGTVTSPEFLSRDQLAEAGREWKALSTFPSAPTYLTRQTLNWARTNPEDPRLPEALHRAVMSTRYGCAEPETAKFSKQAFELLHRRYTDNPWAKKTKYWYGPARQ